MNLNIDIKYLQKDYTEVEEKIITDLFGLVCNNVYFNLKINENIPSRYKFINFNGISGTGKTLIKEHIKQQLISDNCVVLDYDDEVNFVKDYGDKNILEIFNITNHSDELLKIISYFGLFEIRFLLTPIKNLSQGQQTRLKYVHMFYKIKNNTTTYLLIDEFLTFVDEITSLNFSRAIRKYLEDKDIKLFTFGVNSSLIGQFEDITYILGNSCVNAIVENGNIRYKHKKENSKDWE